MLGDIAGPVTMIETYGEVEHPPLRHGHWWACEHPERPPEDLLTRFMFTCVKCFPMFEMAVDDRWVFHDENGIVMEIPAERGDRWNWFMDTERWC